MGRASARRCRFLKTCVYSCHTQEVQWTLRQKIFPTEWFVAAWDATRSGIRLRRKSVTRCDGPVQAGDCMWRFSQGSSNQAKTTRLISSDSRARFVLIVGVMQRQDSLPKDKFANRDRARGHIFIWRTKNSEIRTQFSHLCAQRFLIIIYHQDSLRRNP